MPLRVLMLHNRYLQRGGEDVSFETDCRLLREAGDVVDVYEEDNRRIAELGMAQSAARTIWSRESYWRIRRRLRQAKYDCVHVQNFFPLISPAAYYAARAEGVPVVQTLRNYRLMCAKATLFRDGRVCEDCIGKSVPWPAILHACYRDSVSATLAVSAMIVTHRMLRTWRSAVQAYIALTEFGRTKFVEAGLPADRIEVRPNCIHPDPGVGAHDGGFVLFAGRLSEEKGVQLLLEAWRGPARGIPLTIIGDGPMSGLVAAAAATSPEIRWLGPRSRAETISVMKQATALVFPSQWYETFGLVIAEAYATAMPVVAARLGSAAALVRHGDTGYLYNPNDSSDLASRIRELFSNPELRRAMGAAARRAFEENYSAERSYESLIRIYRTAIERARRERPVA
jgi:glycosyltransferase involved in cell wall biosynthesis